VLAQTLVLIAMIAIVATSVIAGIAGNARAETATAAKALIAPAEAAGIARYESTVLAPAIVAGLAPGDGSAPPGADAALNGGVAWSTEQDVIASTTASTLAAVVTLMPTSTSVPACLPTGGAVNSGADTETNGQCSPFVQESRLSLDVSVDVGPLAGATSVTPLAHGHTIVTLRLFAQPPYAMVAGESDDPAPGDAHEGDVGGYGNALGAFGPAAAPDDTTIHVIEACTPATGDCSVSRPLPADAPTSRPWTNGNIAAGS
jgi:hypothetical protein